MMQSSALITVMDYDIWKDHLIYRDFCADDPAISNVHIFENHAACLSWLLTDYFSEPGWWRLLGWPKESAAELI